MASPTVAANAYANLARILDTGGAGKGSESGGGPSFGALLKDAIGSVLDTGKKVRRADRGDGVGQGQRDGRGDGGGGNRRRGLDAGVGARQGDPSYEDIMKMPI